MKQANEFKARGDFHEAKGRVKEKVGRAPDNSDLEVKGQVEKTRGKVQGKIGQVEKDPGQWRGPLQIA
jgi:uncharacterized protein YjbJ (UPF0337 family)